MQHSKGLTFIGMLFTMALVIFAGIALMRVAPVYIEHYAVVRALKALDTLPSSETSSDPAASELIIKRSLMKQFDIDNVTNVKDNNIAIAPNGDNKLTVTIQYQVTQPFIGNISLLFNFDNSQEVTLGRD